MIIVMKPGATPEQIEAVQTAIRADGMNVHLSKGEFRTIIGAVGDETRRPTENFLALPGVESVVPIMKPYKLASREFHPRDSVVSVKGVPIGGKHTCVISGPCTIENEEMLMRIARQVRDRGAAILRGGAFKPRTSPYSFQGLGEDGLRMLRVVGDELDIPVCTEVMETRQVEVVAKYTDMFQIGARNMQNFNLLTEVGKTGLPVLLKRGLSASVKEFLMSAEYVLATGNNNVVLCERGIKTFEDSVRFTLDIASIPVVRRDSHLPIIVDPSHAAGKRDLVPALAMAGIGAGAHGLIVEVHDKPEQALCDGPQALLPLDFTALMDTVAKFTEALGRELVKPKTHPASPTGPGAVPTRPAREPAWGGKA
jgi:3-deoxy-7-phosphoheptulonate synthase